jgi:signal transduction histidine kinase
LLLERVRETRQRQSEEAQIRERWCELTADPVLDDRGDFQGAVLIVNDITERKRSEAEKADLLAREQAARAEAEAANRLKDEFLATLSHELRTPLHAILGWAHVLRSAWPDPATFQRAVDTIERNARSQEQLVSDVLDVSRIVSGKLRLDLQPVDMATVVDAALAAMGPTADAKGVRLEHKLDRGAGQVLGDRDRLQQVAWNLLSNAIKFTPTGGRVAVLLKPVGEELVLAVQDSGSGIDPDLLPHVFERFRQGDSSTTRAHGGLGLGLAIVQDLVELHGGTVRAESLGEGMGATFIVRLPVTRGPRRIVRTAPAPMHGLRLAGSRVLVVDDDADSRDVLKAVLESAGAEVVTTESAEETRRLFAHAHPNLLIADIGMPEEDGYSLIASIREMESGISHVPAIALTARTRPEDVEQALAAGYQLHLAKPVDSRQLVESIASLVGPAV